MKKTANIDSRIDYTLLLPVLFLLIIGFVSIYIATANDYPDRVGTVLMQQGLWIGFGVALAFVVMFFNTKLLWILTPIGYAIGLALMVMPLIFYSSDLVASTGAKNWVTIGGTTLFQPSEFMKIPYILMLARVVVSDQLTVKRRTLQDDMVLLGKQILVTLPVLILLALQSDLGTALVFIAILAGVVLISGISGRLIWPIVIIFLIFAVVLLSFFLIDGGTEFLHNTVGISTYQINRISAWLDPFAFSETITYQQSQSLITIGSGGFLGKGFNVAELAVPVRESDMIFTVIAENFGFVGGVVLLLLYLFLIFRMMQVTIRSNNRFYTYISTGFTMMLLFHIFENIGAAIGILPLTGIPLPFVSQGGSSLITNLVGVGLVLSISYQNSITSEREILQSMSRSRRYR